MSWQGWNDENTAEAKRLWLEGLSAAQVARRIGASRNAVIGKVTRLGLTTSNRQRASAPNAEARRTRPKLNPKPILKIAGNGTVFERSEAREPRVTTTFREGPGGLRIIDPGFGGCRWPLNGEGAEVRFCCARPVDGQPYCADHARDAYMPPVPGKKRDARELTRSLRRYIA